MKKQEKPFYLEPTTPHRVVANCFRIQELGEHKFDLETYLATGKVYRDDELYADNSKEFVENTYDYVLEPDDDLDTEGMEKKIFGKIKRYDIEIKDLADREMIIEGNEGDSGGVNTVSFCGELHPSHRTYDKEEALRLFDEFVADPEGRYVELMGCCENTDGECGSLKEGRQGDDKDE